MAAEVDIANRAITKLGGQAIVSLTEDSRNARAANANYATLRDAELEEHTWSFAVKRASLAASTTSPLFTKGYAFPLPSDFLRILPKDPEDNTNDVDWEIEGQTIVTNDTAPLDVRYVARITDTSAMPALFREAVACRLALELCELITNSNTKAQLLEAQYQEAIRKAKRTNAIQRQPAAPAADLWETIRA